MVEANPRRRRHAVQLHTAVRVGSVHLRGEYRMPHFITAIAFQLILVAFGADTFVAAFASNGLFVMREITQAEYRYIERHGYLRANMEWWRGMDIRLWNGHSIRNVLKPALATFLVALATRFI